MNLRGTYRIYVVALCTFLSMLMSFGQSDECGQITNEEDYLQYYLQIKRQAESLERQFLEERSKTSRLYKPVTSLPIKAHIVRNSNGSGGLSESALNKAISTMNSYYANAGLEFFLCEGINYIDNSNFYILESNEETSLTSANSISNVINIYFVDTIYSSSGSSLCGYAYYPGGPENILMANACTTNGSTLSHEMGHFFGLFHTHGNSSTPASTNELANGSNCESTGDYICDTPADPKLSSSNVNSNCVYTGTYRDNNNQPFDPQTENIMSYSRRSCRTMFSDEQYARINATYQLSRSNLRCPDFAADFSADITESCEANLTVTFTENSEGANAWSWDVDGDGYEDYSSRNITHTYTNPGDYDVSLTITNGNTSISKAKSNYIEVGADEISTEEISLHLTLDNWPSETTWQFTSDDGNILYSGGPYEEGTDDNTTKIERFSIDPDQCYKFEIFDAYGDGICCSNGNGKYELKDASNRVIASGSDFGRTAVNNFFNGNLLGNNEFIKDEISLYPNPVSDQLNIAINNGILPQSLVIYNSLGQQLLQKTIQSENDLSLSTERFKSGLYVLKLQNESGEISMPFIKR